MFPLANCLSRGQLEMFKYLYEKQASLWRVEHLTLILEEASAHGEALDFVLTHPRTAILFKYLTYPDRIALTKHLSALNPERAKPVLSTQKPFLGPYLFGRFH